MGSAIPRMRRLDTRFYAAALVFAIALIAIRVGIVIANRDLRDASVLAEHSQQVLAASDAVQRLTVDLETGLRGWQLTNDRQFLEPTQQAQRELPGAAGRAGAARARRPGAGGARALARRRGPRATSRTTSARR